MTGSSTSPAGGSNVHIDVDDRQQAFEIDSRYLGELLAAVLTAQHGDVLAEAGLTFVDVDEMTDLNVAHMQGVGPTDVLAFPIDGVGPPGGVPSKQPAMLGDVVICPEVAAKAPQPLADELALLVVHGALHLLGHDHAEAEETAVMQSLEIEMLDRFHRR